MNKILFESIFNNEPAEAKSNSYYSAFFELFKSINSESLEFQNNELINKKTENIYGYEKIIKVYVSEDFIFNPHEPIFLQTIQKLLSFYLQNQEIHKEKVQNLLTMVLDNKININKLKLIKEILKFNDIEIIELLEKLVKFTNENNAEIIFDIIKILKNQNYYINCNPIVMNKFSRLNDSYYELSESYIEENEYQICCICYIVLNNPDHVKNYGLAILDILLTQKYKYSRIHQIALSIVGGQQALFEKVDASNQFYENIENLIVQDFSFLDPDIEITQCLLQIFYCYPQEKRENLVELITQKLIKGSTNPSVNVFKIFESLLNTQEFNQICKNSLIKYSYDLIFLQNFEDLLKTVKNFSENDPSYFSTFFDEV